MNTRKLSFEIKVYRDMGELSGADQELMRAAMAARDNAYAPYSGFQVGAALLLEDGVVVTGNNQENASYPSGLCAERVAVFHAGASYPGHRMKALAICAFSPKYPVRRPVAPCGNCRQVLSEYEGRQGLPIRLLFMGGEGEVFECASVADILPFGFTKDHLGPSEERDGRVSD